MRRNIMLSRLLAGCLSLATAFRSAGLAQGDERADKAKEGPIGQAQAAELRKMSHQKLFSAYAAAEMEGYASRYRKILTKDQVLTEIIQRGDAECEEFLKKEFEATKKQKDFEAQNLELLTALRRVQKKPDPVIVEVRIPEDLEVTTRSLPRLQVALKNVDEEKTLVTIRLWRRLPQRPPGPVAFRGPRLERQAPCAARMGRRADGRWHVSGRGPSLQ